MAERPHSLRLALGCLVALAALGSAYSAWADARYAHRRTISGTEARGDDSVGLAKNLDLRLQTRPDTPISSADIASLEKGLEGAPLSRAALRIIGVHAEASGDIGRADAAFGLSNRLSRRDAMTQLWLIERAVNQEDMNSAVRHYHAVLSVHPELQATLLPILSKAIAFPEVRKALAPYVARQARWSTAFLDNASRTGDPKNVVLLTMPIINMLRGGKYDEINARLITQLAGAGDFATAHMLAQKVVPGTNTASLSLLTVNDVTTDKRLGALAWSLAEEGRILTSANAQGGFDFDVEPLFLGTAASRIFSVAGGRTYTLSQTLRSDASDAAAVVSWQASCIPSQAVVWEQRLPKPRGGIQRYQSAITVPNDCKGLKFLINIRGPDGSQPAHVALETLDFRPKLD